MTAVLMKISDAFMDFGEGVDATTPITEALEELATIAHSENWSEISLGLNERHTTGGACGYKIDGKLTFVTQVESYKFRGIHFVDYSPTEFACIVDIIPRQNAVGGTSSRGRKRRKTFDLDPKHRLYSHYEAVIRVKMLTPMFGGRSPPTVSRKTNGRCKMDGLARYIIAVTVPWNDNQRPQFDPNASD
ncbi:hypothetical protein F443_05195 [Phytophthora nicotianae P1569]|uniref:Uncharacterized protein n=1 Tax=Phytophthora nicotianae P1569 TaxID=1317065 RepID=V9FIY5_PHYNI|nr:hypothetical protein F443_05195 [Phytophthora nicotianae P1569]